jgi:hypothetical protein
MRLALAGIALAVALSAAAVSQEEPAAPADPSSIVLVYTVLDLTANFPTVGPLVIPVASLPPQHWHGWEATVPVVAPADGSKAPAEYRIHCRATRISADKMQVSAGVEYGDLNHTAQFDLGVAKDQCVVFRLPRGGQGRFVFVYSICEPLARR